MCAISLLGYEVRNSQNSLGHLTRIAQTEEDVGRRVNSRGLLFSIARVGCWRQTVFRDFICRFIYRVVFVMMLSFSVNSLYPQ